VDIYYIKYTESKSVDLIQRNTDIAPMQYFVKTLTDIWVTKKHTSIIINPVNEESVTGELFVTKKSVVLP
jgi:hypothetical protein